MGDVWSCLWYIQYGTARQPGYGGYMFCDEISAYENTNIRQLKVPNLFNFHAPQKKTGTLPETTDAEKRHELLRLWAIFFAKAMYEKTHNRRTHKLQLGWQTPV